MKRVWKEIWQLFLQQLLLKHCDGGGLVVKSCLTLVTPWTIALHAPLSMGLPRQEYCSGLPFPSPRNLPDPGIEPKSLVSPAFGWQILYLLSHQRNPLKHYFVSDNSLSKIRDSSWPTPTTMLLEKDSQGQSVMSLLNSETFSSSVWFSKLRVNFSRKTLVLLSLSYSFVHTAH